MASPSRRAKLLLAAGATLVALLLAEVFARVRMHRLNQGSIERAFSDPAARRNSKRIALIDIIRPSTDRKIVYELKPNLEQVQFKGVPVSTNGLGFRCEEIDEAAGADTVTIVGIGDSIMFGWGVGDGKEYCSILQGMLRAKYPAKKWRVINTGVPGYNTVMEVETLRTRGLAFHPDVVILNIVPNDIALPEYIREVQDVLDPRRSFLFELCRDGFRRSAGAAQLVRQVPGENEGAAPHGYEDMVGLDPYRRAVAELAELATAHGFAVLSVSTIEDEITPQLLDAAKAAGFPHVTLLPDIQAFMEEKSGTHFSIQDPSAYMQSALVVKDDGHPSPLQHKMIAERLLERLEKDGVIARLLKK